MLDPIPDRIPKLRELLANAAEYVAYLAALVLAAWGDSSGVEYLRERVLGRPQSEEPLDSHRLDATRDEAPDLALEAVHLYAMTTGDLATRNDLYSVGLQMYGDTSFQGRFQSALRRDHPAQILGDAVGAYERTMALGLRNEAMLLLPALLAMGDPDIRARIVALEKELSMDEGTRKDLRSAANDLERRNGSSEVPDWVRSTFPD